MSLIILDDIIAAISTPPGNGGIGIVRLSGKGCIEKADEIFKSRTGIKLADKKSHTVTYGDITDGEEVIDEALVTVMKAPSTYTKEDIVEINCHGGNKVTSAVLDLVIKKGARLAEPGEFTKRAFLNGRIDLTQAEAVMDIIDAKTDAARKAAVNQLSGRLKEEISALREDILSSIATVEAAIDYPEHDIEEITYFDLGEDCKRFINKLETLLETSERGKIIKEGISTAIIGKPNSGKSSLLNYLLDEERAIVTDIAGTTRDTVEEFINLDGIPVKLIDTAGIRETGDIVEKIGVDKSKASAENADLCIFITDASEPLTKEDKEILDFVKDKKIIALFNKTDKGVDTDIDYVKTKVGEENCLLVSVKKGEGINILLNRIKEMFLGGDINFGGETLINNVRHKNLLYNTLESINNAVVAIDNRIPEDFVSLDLKQAYEYLGEIIGESVDEDIIDKIFSKFCLGK